MHGMKIAGVLFANYELISMNNIMTYLQSSPLPQSIGDLKGRIAVNFSRNKLATITPPAGGQGVSRCDNILFP
jgi:hypothetical protein